MRSAGTPVGPPRLLLIPALPPRVLLVARRFPQPPSREPPQQHVLVRPFELIRRRQELLAVARAERGGLAVDQDGPIGEAGRHACYSSDRSVHAQRDARRTEGRPTICYAVSCLRRLRRINSPTVMAGPIFCGTVT